MAALPPGRARLRWAGPRGRLESGSDRHYRPVTWDVPVLACDGVARRMPAPPDGGDRSYRSAYPLVTGVTWVQLGCRLGVCSVYAIFSAFW